MDKKKVLVVEDDILLRATLVRALEAAGFSTAVAEDGEQGLAKYESESPHACVFDIILPKKNGLELLEEIRAAHPEKKTPVVMLTNVDDMDSLSRAVAQDAVAYVIKSEDALDTVAAIIREKLGA